MVFFSFPLIAATHQPEAFIESLSGRKDQAAQIVSHFCSSCHAKEPLIALGAPRIGTPDWKQRLKKGFDVLYQHTLEGVGAMPPRGGCFECSDQQLKEAIQYMLPK